jgi:hypothetical protein
MQQRSAESEKKPLVVMWKFVRKVFANSVGAFPGATALRRSARAGT